MIIDLILNRQDDEKDLAKGYTHVQLPDGTLRPLAYDPARFYREVFAYGEIGFEITRAMDAGTENDVKAALCRYVMDGEYNPAICAYIINRSWLTA